MYREAYRAEFNPLLSLILLSPTSDLSPQYFQYGSNIHKRDIIICFSLSFTSLYFLASPFHRFPSSSSPLSFVLSIIFFDFFVVLLLTHLFCYFSIATACSSHRSYGDSQGCRPWRSKLWQDSIPRQILCRSDGKRKLSERIGVEELGTSSIYSGIIILMF